LTLLLCVIFARYADVVELIYTFLVVIMVLFTVILHSTDRDCCS